MRISLYFLAVMLVFTALPAFASQPRVVASFSILADITQAIGGDAIQVDSLVGVGQDMHGYRPTPQDSQKLAQADLVIVNGLGFEGWLDRLIKASGYKNAVVVASKGISPLAASEAEHDHHHKDAHEHDHGAVDPHVWQSPVNARIYVRNIAAALSQLVPDQALAIAERAAAYDAVLVAIDQSIQQRLKIIPQERRLVVTSHDAFGYFAQAYDIEFVSIAGLSTQEAARPSDVARVEKIIRDNKAAAIFLENAANDRLLNSLAKDLSVKIGGTLYADALTAGGEAASYLNLLRHNSDAILGALHP